MKIRLAHSGVVARVALFLFAPAVSIAAQLPNPSAAATGLSGAYSAAARGYEAVAWNPANLGMPGAVGFSLGVLAVTGSTSLEPLKGQTIVPHVRQHFEAQRADWLQTVAANGGEHGQFDGGVTYLGLSAGPFALQVATSVNGSAALNPDAFEQLMYGPAGRPGNTRALDAGTSDFRTSAFTTTAVSYGYPVENDVRAGKHSALGFTGKYILGNYLAMAQSEGPGALPGVYSNLDSGRVVGRGLGIDVGLAWADGTTTYSATIENVYNNFSWDTSKLRSRPGGPLFREAATSAPDHPFADAPQTLRDRVTSDQFKRVIALGTAFAASKSVTISWDVRRQTGDGILVGPRTQTSGGIELRGLPVVRLRGGASYLTGGWGVSGGLGLALGRYELAAGAALRKIDGVNEPVVTLNLLSFK
ncbi:MAG: hypothetical protein JWM41_42 [Gemmatimonadetes bacterium]|nr:hypothetical protein [Gemmatimonadota bacterium]